MTATATTTTTVTLTIDLATANKLATILAYTTGAWAHEVYTALHENGALTDEYTTRVFSDGEAFVGRSISLISDGDRWAADLADIVD